MTINACFSFNTKVVVHKKKHEKYKVLTSWCIDNHEIYPDAVFYLLFHDPGLLCHASVFDFTDSVRFLLGQSKIFCISKKNPGGVKYFVVHDFF